MAAIQQTSITIESLRLTGAANCFQVSHLGNKAILRLDAGDPAAAEAIALEIDRQLQAGTIRLQLVREAS